MTLKTITQLMLAGSLGLMGQAAFADRADAEENLHKLKLPEGFHINVYAEVEGARQMALGQSTGTVFVGTRGNNVFAVVDKNKDRKADKVVKILDDLKVGNGVAVHQGNLYVAEQNRIAIYPAPGFDLNLPFKQMREVIYDKLPDKAHHGWRYIAFGPDNKLYVTVGAPCNICNPQGIEASIIRMNADGSDAEIYAKGIRNSVGMDFQPDTGTLYFTDNNVDMMGDDNPPGELNAAPKAGMHFGFPYYAGGKAQHPDWKDKQAPQDVTFPVQEFQAHTASLGLKFYTGDMFPADYKGDAIIAQHGSWNRTSPVGYQLMRVTFDDNHQVTGHEVFIDGWLQNGEAWGRPTDVLQLADGSLLISDDYNDVIYRVSYGDDNASSTDATSQSNSKTITDLQMPESAIAAPDGRVFVTEIGEFGKAGDGKVTVIDKSGQKTTLATGLNDPKGIDLWNNELYIADVDHVVKVDMKGDITVIAKAKNFPGKPVFLNDMEIDGNGTLYVSDSGTDDGENAGIYQITQAGKVSEILDDKSAIKRPNGLLMDGNDTLLVADFGTGDLYRANISSGKTEALNKGFGGADGLVRDSKGYLYVSDWQNGKVWQLVEPKATPQLLSDDFVSAADISLSADGQYLMVPDMKGSKLVYLPIQ
ncbi:MAG: PQQ-dependent sugar dehydrogenase [Pseudomonadota bacterium]|uniref:PQQ-dependent sugar dehydrogenase n=2 Tax=Pseudomonadati TaxID=3379134 RepID=UPI0024E22524|nr:PQQ-dependent sugar dehydrogenase [Methylophaga aminisulfidivorans]MEC9413166.1 PQQ-dependent sugar dehydrogenase [Pseudomonadota bacterium]